MGLITIKHKDLSLEAAQKDAHEIISLVFQHFARLSQTVLPDYLFNLGFCEFFDFDEILGGAFYYSVLQSLAKEKKDLFVAEGMAEAKKFPVKALWENGLFVQEMQNLYAFAVEGETGGDMDSALEFRLQLLTLLFSSPLGTHVFSIELIERRFPRLAYALRLVDARLAIQLGQQDISPAMLALLADVTYMAIIKKIKQGEINATKEGGEWRISREEALRWLDSYIKKRRKKH